MTVNISLEVDWGFTFGISISSTEYNRQSVETGYQYAHFLGTWELGSRNIWRSTVRFSA